jgi:hypothetical protein
MKEKEVRKVKVKMRISRNGLVKGRQNKRTEDHQHIGVKDPGSNRNVGRKTNEVKEIGRKEGQNIWARISSWIK